VKQKRSLEKFLREMKEDEKSAVKVNFDKLYQEQQGLKQLKQEITSKGNQLEGLLNKEVDDWLPDDKEIQNNLNDNKDTGILWLSYLQPMN